MNPFVACMLAVAALAAMMFAGVPLARAEVPADLAMACEGPDGWGWTAPLAPGEEPMDVVHKWEDATTPGQIIAACTTIAQSPNTSGEEMRAALDSRARYHCDLGQYDLSAQDEERVIALDKDLQDDWHSASDSESLEDIRKSAAGDLSNWCGERKELYDDHEPQ